MSWRFNRRPNRVRTVVARTWCTPVLNASARFVTIVPGGVNAHSAGFVFAGFAAQKCASPLAFLCVGQVALC